MNSPWKLIFVLVGIFAAGAVTGVFVERRLKAPRVEITQLHRSTVATEQWAPKQLKRLVDGLELNAEQAEQILPIIRRNMEELDRLRSHSRAETSGIFERMARDISEKLTPEQRVKYAQMNAESRERARTDGGSRGERLPPPPNEHPPAK
jgi:Spy/CpxP family protein refolding chaperone